LTNAFFRAAIRSTGKSKVDTKHETIIYELFKKVCEKYKISIEKDVLTISKNEELYVLLQRMIGDDRALAITIEFIEIKLNGKKETDFLVVVDHSASGPTH